MGYTHYWKFSPTNETAKQFKIVLDECKKIVKSHPNIAFGWDEEKQGFYDEPTFTEDLIEFNGDESNELEYETFVFDPNTHIEFNFTKTARRPYDLIVCLVLISLSKHLDGFSFSSDGNDIEWKPIYDEYKKLFGK